MTQTSDNTLWLVLYNHTLQKMKENTVHNQLLYFDENLVLNINSGEEEKCLMVTPGKGGSKN